jgi:hypothetical protein
LVCLVGFAAAARHAAPSLAVDAGAGRHPISPYAYRINEYADNGLAGMMRIPPAPLRR